MPQVSSLNYNAVLRSSLSTLSQPACHSDWPVMSWAWYVAMTTSQIATHLMKDIGLIGASSWKLFFPPSSFNVWQPLSFYLLYKWICVWDLLDRWGEEVSCTSLYHWTLCSVVYLYEQLATLWFVISVLYVNDVTSCLLKTWVRSLSTMGLCEIWCCIIVSYI